MLRTYIALGIVLIGIWVDLQLGMGPAAVVTGSLVLSVVVGLWLLQYLERRH